MAYNMEELVGKTITRILISPNDEILVFVTTDGTFAYETEGDCCSHTWYESVTGVEALLGHTVTAQESIEMPEAIKREVEYKNDHYQEELQDYGQKLTTEKGVIDIVYRNSSNGYYGGSINCISTVPDISQYKEITADWSAA